MYTSHDDGRRLVRSLVEWAESDIGRFHHRISVVMCRACGAGFWRWHGEPGAGYLLVAVFASVLSLAALRHRADRPREIS